MGTIERAHRAGLDLTYRAATDSRAQRILTLQRIDIGEYSLGANHLGIEVRDVAAGGMDFRAARRVEPGMPDFDTCFCLADGRQPLREVLRLTGQAGVGMSVSTTEAGVQVYDARDARRPGRGAHEGLAVEAQGWPDAPNHAGFPSIELAPGEEYRQHTVWRFSRG